MLFLSFKLPLLFRFSINELLEQGTLKDIVGASSKALLMIKQLDALISFITNGKSWYENAILKIFLSSSWNITAFSIANLLAVL